MGAFREGGSADQGVEGTAGFAPVRVMELTEFWDDLCLLERALAAGAAGEAAASRRLSAPTATAVQNSVFRGAAADRERLRDALVALHFPCVEAQQALRSTAEWIARMVAGQDPTTGAARQAAFSRAAAAAGRLTALLGKLDAEKLVGSWALSDPEPPRDSLGRATRADEAPRAAEPPADGDRRLEQLARLRGRLSHVADSLRALASREPASRRGAPSLPDPLLFAIECLAAIWRRFHPEVPLTGSRNRGGFNEFACAFLNAPPFDFSEETIQTAVRYYVASARRRAQSDG